MAVRSLRGIRLGAQSLQSEEGVVFMERRETTYTCDACGTDTTLMFAADAAAPHTWECRNCGHLVMGKKAPAVCPVCKHPLSFFEVRKENY